MNHSTASPLVGETVARLHRAGDQFVTSHSRFELGLGYLLEEPLRRLQPYLPAEDYGYLNSVAGRIRDRPGSLSLPADGWGIIHGDLHKGNSHLTADGRLTLFDFDIAGYGWRAYDAATFCTGTSESCRAAFLEGYPSVRPLSEAEPFPRWPWPASSGTTATLPP